MNKYYFDLLQIRASDKAYIAHTSDSAILSVINYFENHDFNNLLPIAYYYGGRVYSDLGDAPQALEYFQKALDCPNINSHTQAVAYSQIAGIYNRQNIYDLAIPAYKKAVELSENNDNIIGVIYNSKGLGNIYFKEDNNDSALILYNNTLKLAEKFKYNKIISSIKLNIAELYLFKHDYDQAHRILNSLNCVQTKEDSTTIANTFAHLYYLIIVLTITIPLSSIVINLLSQKILMFN